MGSCFGLCIIFCLLSLAGGREGAGQGRAMLFRGKIPHGFFRERREGSGEETPWRSCLIAQHHPPGHGSCGWTAGQPAAGAGMGVTGCSPSWTKDGGCHGAGTVKGKPTQGGTSWLHCGWIRVGEVGDSPSAPPERCLSVVRVRGSAEGGEERGKGGGRTCQRCPGALGQGRVWLLPCRGAGKGAEGTSGHGAVLWRVWGCFTPRVHWRPWHPSCVVVSACKEYNPPRQGGSTPHAALSACRRGRSAHLQTPEGPRGRFRAGVRNPWWLGVVGAVGWLCRALAGGTRHARGWLGCVLAPRPAPGTRGQTTVRCSARDVASPPALSKPLWIIIFFLIFWGFFCLFYFFFSFFNALCSD